MEPWQSWAAAICIGGAAFWYYTKDSKYFMKPREARSASISEQTSSQQSSKRRNERQAAKRKDTATSKTPSETPQTYANIVAATPSPNPSSVSKKRKAGRPSGPQFIAPNKTSATSAKTAELREEEDFADDDKEWAKQLDASRKGVVIGSSSKSGNQQKLRTKHQNETLSRSNSQATAINGQEGTASKVDVSDMLEPAPAAPTTLRVTGNQEPKKPQVQKAEPAQETKKQRQNRRKAEEKRLQREEDEKQRQTLLNNQRRAAREARGEPARNGVVPSNPSAKSVWSAPTQVESQLNGSNTNTASTIPSNGASLLDTFEPDGLSTASSNEAYTDATTPATVASTMDQNLPSEEAQMEMLKKLDENVGWSEVASKGKRSKKKQSAATTESATPVSSAPSTGRDSNPFSAIYTGDVAAETEIPTSGPKINGQTNGLASVRDSEPNLPWKKGHPDDSDWAVY